ncbi:N-acetyl-alpha-D-glucosaminyl L-malate synthase BshA [Candidatus Woesearchaeota archaeon]|nr:MAG: N-acetyl-alpha-D-glucosaminyl L-malate synthase BshA [Candidatus Woesearchaeota archaeon]
MEKNEPLTIVKVLYARPHIGGSGIMGTELALELARRGHDVHIVSYPGTYLSKEEEKLLKIHPIPDITYGSFKTPPTALTFPGTIRMLANDLSIDVLHAHYGVTHGEAVIDARDILRRDMKRGKLTGQKRNPVAIISNVGTDVSVNGYRPVMVPGLELRLSQADGITFVSKSLQDEARAVFDLDDYGVVIPNFINEENFQRPEDDHINKELRERLGIGLDELVFYHVSNFRPVKNVGTIVDAYNNAVERGMKGTRLLFVGDGPEKHVAETKAKKYGLKEQVIFTGMVPHERVADYHQVGNVLVLPSLKESFGLVSLEAMHLGNAVIASNRGGIPEVVESGVSGYLADPKDIAAFAHYMLVLAQNPEKMREMGEEGKRIARQRFDRAKVCSMYEDLYYSLLKKQNRAE